MSDTRDESFDVIAKEITIALIQKSAVSGESLLAFACEAYDKLYKQISETYNSARK